MMKTKSKKFNIPTYDLALPPSLKVSPDELKIRLDFFESSIVMHTFEGKDNSYRMVDAMDLAQTLAKELSYSTGLLPDNVLWWTNTASGPVTALWVPADIRKVALSNEAGKPPKRYKIPLPGLIFICSPGKAPWVYAAKRKPTKPKDMVYKAPLCNTYDDGRTCPGNNKYPSRVEDVVESFFISFFTEAANLNNRSKKHPDNIALMWKELDGKTEYPLDDLVVHGQVEDLMRQKL
jgi:PRTRC genetic system protein B